MLPTSCRSPIARVMRSSSAKRTSCSRSRVSERSRSCDISWRRCSFSRRRCSVSFSSAARSRASASERCVASRNASSARRRSALARDMANTAIPVKRTTRPPTNIAPSGATGQQYSSRLDNALKSRVTILKLPCMISALRQFLARSERLFILTGAGCSTDSGIPDYRDGEGAWKRARPVLFDAFMSDALVRQRYWARSMAGWRRFQGARPNDAHRALAQLEREDRVEALVTQNVDRLHQLAGSRDVIDLHGRLDFVRCMSCGQRLARDA